MTPWSWWAGEIGEDCYDLACECKTREEAIQQALRRVSVGERFNIVEARSSEAKEHEGSDLVPFLRTRNAEVLTAGPTLLRTLAGQEVTTQADGALEAPSTLGTDEPIPPIPHSDGEEG